MPFDMKSIALDTTPASTNTILFGAINGQTDTAPAPIPITILSTYFQNTLGLNIGTSSIANGTTGRLLYDNAAVLGEALLTYSAAQLQMGAADAASPVAQTLQVQSVVTGTTNTAGANWTFNGSKSTGSAAGGDIVWQLSAAGSSGSSVNAVAELFRFKTNGNLSFGGSSGPAIGTAILTGQGVSFNPNGQTTMLSANNSFFFEDATSGGAITIQVNGLGGGRSTVCVPANNTLQLGAGDAASPVAQTFQVQNVVAGTSNTAGVNWTLNGSLSTGSGTSGDIIFQTGGTGAGATSQNTATAALTLKGATQQAIFATNVRINVAPTANTSAGPSTITSSADSATNLGHRISFNLNGTTYWIPCGSVAF